jgi:predicted metal-binding membrane protein
MEGRMIRKPPLYREQVAVLAILALLTVGAWIITLTQMQNMAAMDEGMAAPSTMGPGAMPGQPTMGGMTMDEATRPDPGVRLVTYLGMWTAMMAAMMLPAAAPMILLFGTLSRTKRERGDSFVPTWVFVAGYLAVWVGFGAVAWALGDFVEAIARAYPMVRELGPRLAAAAMIAAGLYQLTPLKQRCLSHCRSPLSFLMHHWRPGAGGAWRMGIDHGVYCVGCCWVLFVLLIVVGLASLPWMGLITLIVCAEKLLPFGRPVTLAVAGLLIVLGVLTLIRPDLMALTTG